LLLIDKVGRQIRFFDPAARTEISHFEVGPAPHDFAISGDHKTAYVPIYGDGIYGRNPHPGHEILIIDLESQKQTGTIDVSPYQAPHGIQIDAAGMLYVACDLSRKLLVVNPKTRAIEAAIDTESTGHWLAVLPDGSKAYVANKNDRLFVSVIDLKARRLIGRIPAPNGTQGITASPDGRSVIAVDYAQPTLLVIDPKKDAIVDRITIDGQQQPAYKPRYSPDGSRLLVCSLDGSATILDAANLHGTQTRLAVGKDPMGFAFSADGRLALVANHGDGSMSVIDLAAKKVVGQFAGGSGIETVTYF
jgi:DNA-binding beta-propeller fold protein YncE